VSWLNMPGHNSLTYTPIYLPPKPKPMAKIKTFEAACKALKLDPVKVLPKVSGMPTHHQEAIVAHAKLVIITEALNEGWKPNWKDSSEWKYYPWFDMRSGSGLSYNVYDLRNSYSHVGSRLCLKSSELAKYAGTTFKKLYTQYFCL
jgi:hypothetical protein